MSKKIKEETLNELASISKSAGPLKSELAVDKKLSFEQGKLYLAKEDVWAIDYNSNKDFMLVFAREQQFKIKPEDLVLLGE